MCLVQYCQKASSCLLVTLENLIYKDLLSLVIRIGGKLYIVILHHIFQVVLLSFLTCSKIFFRSCKTYVGALFSDINYKWTRDFFPNFVEEDRRVFVSSDGALYFSALQEIDRGNYSCTAQSKVSSIGRTGPFFHLNIVTNREFLFLTINNTKNSQALTLIFVLLFSFSFLSQPIISN